MRLITRLITFTLLRVALALLSVAIVILIISAAHPVGSNDPGVLTAFPP